MGRFTPLIPLNNINTSVGRCVSQLLWDEKREKVRHSLSHRLGYVMWLFLLRLRDQYLKLDPPRNSRRSDVEGMNSSEIGSKYRRKR